MINKMYKQNISKEQFLENYFNYLKESTNIPIDILNSKIDTFDIVYSPFMIERTVIDISVEADIGKDRRIQKYMGQKFNKETFEVEPIYEYETVTDWHHEIFNLTLSENDCYLFENEFKDLLVSEYGTAEKISKKFPNPQFEEFPSNNVILGQFPWQEHEKNIKTMSKKIDKLIDNALYKKGDRARNILTKSIQNKNESTIMYICIPIGYIKYKYEEREYYYIQLLTGNENSVLKATKPECNPIPDGLGGKSSSLFFFYSTYWIIFFLVAKFVKNYISWVRIGSFEAGCIKAVIICFAIYTIFDWLSKIGSEMEVEDKYISKRKQYLNEIFSFHLPKIKSLLKKEEKKYKEV